MNSGHHVYYLLDYNTGTWLRCGNVIINIYSGYPENVYNDLSHENEQKMGGGIMNVPDRILSMLYIKRHSHIQNILVLYWVIII